MGNRFERIFLDEKEDSLGLEETRVQDQRLLLVKEFASAERSRTEICLSHGVSRKTGYKWYEQYRVHGVGGLADRSRAPDTQPHAVDEPTVGAILELRSRHPSWGERKLKAWLERERPERSWLHDPILNSAELDVIGLINELRKRRGSVIRPGKRPPVLSRSACP